MCWQHCCMGYGCGFDRSLGEVFSKNPLPTPSILVALDAKV